MQRPDGMSLAEFLQVGMLLRAQAGIDTLERGLKLPATSKSQEQLRNYALQALRRTQQRLLLKVLERAKRSGDLQAAVQRADQRDGPDAATPSRPTSSRRCWTSGRCRKVRARTASLPALLPPPSP